MTLRIVLAALVAALAWGPVVTFAQQKPNCPQPSASPGTQSSTPSAPTRIEGQVSKIDREKNMVTLKMSDGSTQQFRGDKETIDDLKVGDRIEAKKRTPDC